MNFIQKIVQEIETFWDGEVLPDAKKLEIAAEKAAQNWLKQFETDFGKTALNIAVSFINSLEVGTPLPTVIALGATVAAELEKAAIATAEQDAQEVILNAARTALTPPFPNAASVPADTATLSTPASSVEPPAEVQA